MRIRQTTHCPHARRFGGLSNNSATMEGIRFGIRIALVLLIICVVEASVAVAATPADSTRTIRNTLIRHPPAAAADTDIKSSRRNLHNADGTPIDHQTDIRQYELWEPQEIRETVERWAEHYPKLIHVTTAQEAYGLPAAGGSEDCPFDTEGPGCLNQILWLQDFEAHPVGSASSNRLPELLWSGEVHGNEQVGPTAVLEAVDLLLEAATCEASPRVAVKKTHSDRAWQQELEKAHSCRDSLAEKGIDNQHRQWLARLLTTRRIVVVPTANALGYYQKVREENRIDPNRDFPYDQTDPRKCMQTVAGRTLNEVFREHLFQLSLTFHGGMEVVGYEWGAPYWDVPKDSVNNPPRLSPDDTAQAQIAAAYSRFAGGWATTKPYDYGPMNDLVYGVHGGMEDWAYAGSWDPERVIQCEPLTYDGYDAAKTVYDNSTLRVFNMLVETSNDKIPHKSDLGTSLDIMTNSPDGNGHVARNIRLALLAAELVEPYVVIRSVNELDLTDDLVPLTEDQSDPRTCQTTKTVAVPHNSRKAVVRWTVGGALTVDETSLWYTKWTKELEVALGDCSAQPNENVVAMLAEATAIGATSGATQFSANAPFPPFAASIDISDFAAGDKLAVFARARVDQDWANGPQPQPLPNVPPQSHIVNARTNPDWRHERADGKVIQGRLDWYSVPLTIVLTEYKDNRVESEELSMRYDETQMEHEDAGGDSSGSAEKEAFGWTLIMLIVAIVATLGYVGGRTYLYYTMRKTHRERVRDYIEDESAVTPGLKHIAVAAAGGKKKKGYADVTTEELNGELELGEYSDNGGLA